MAISVDNKALKSGDEFGAAITPTIGVTDISATTIVATLDGAAYIPGTPIAAEGNHTLAVTVTDAANWQTVVPPITFAIDMSAPVVKVTEHDVPFESGTKFNRNVEPKIVVTDLTKTVIDAKLDGAAYTPDSVITSEGNHTLTISVTDNLGHLTVVPPIAFLLDKTAPVVSVVANGTPIVSGAAFLNSVKPEILVTDVSKTTVDAKLNGQPFVSGLEITAEGKYTLTVTVTDEVGWVTTVPAIEFFVDATAPVVELRDHHDELLKNDSWYAESVTPKAIITDTTPTTTTATLNGQPFTMGTQITAEGKYTLAVKVVDQVGLATDVPPVTFTIDKTAPAITFTSPVANSTITTREVVVTGDSDDAISIFVNGAEAVIDAATKKFASPSIDLLEGPNVISAVAHDRAGNKSEPSMTVTLDTRAPELTITLPAENACIDATQVEVKGTAFGDVSSIKVTAGNAAPVNATLSADSRSWTAMIPTPGEGRLTLTIAANDASGHASTLVRSVVIDRTKPVIEVTEFDAPFTATLVNRPVALSVRAKDVDAKATLTITLDDAPFATGDVITTEGTHTLKAKATDCAGHVSDEKVVVFRIDRTPPMITNLVPANGARIGNKPPITGTVSEPATIVAEGTPYTATLAGNSFTIAAALEEGLNQFSLLATDAAGNQSRLPYAFSVKSTAPAVEIVENGSPIPANALFNRDVTPVVRASDADATITATKNGAPFTSGTTISDDGTHTITAKATDTFGHESSTVTATFRIDKTAPSVKITEPAEGAKATAGSITVRGTVSADAKTVLVNGVSATLPGNGTFSAQLTLDGSDLSIVAIAMDEAGNSASDQVDLVAEGGKLAIILTSPADKMVTNRPHTVVAGQVLTPADAESLTVNGNATTFDAVGSFLIPDFVLAEGDNPITATVKKKAGATNSVTVTVKADFTPPVLKVLANSIELAAGARFATSPSIVLDATDNFPGVVTRLTIDGTTITGTVGTLADGGHSLTAVARDAAGNETRVDRTFFIGGSVATTGCALNSIDPVDNASVFDSTIHITGRSGGAAAVLINGTRAEVSDGSFCGEANLVAGRNEITIQCANADGTATNDAPLKVIYYRYLDPTITISSPSNGAVVTNAKTTVSGTVGAGVVEGDVNGIRFTVPNDGAATHNFTVADVTLAPGLNVIAARAQTTSHRGGVATVRVKLLTTTPQIAITSPLTGMSTGSNSVDVSGTYANIDPSTITITAGSSTVSATVRVLTDTTGTFSIASVNLAGGAKTTITASGRNAANAQATSSVEVEQVATAPQITITSPVDNTFIPASNTAKIHVTGHINDVANPAVQVNGVAATLTGSDFSADVDQTTTTGGSTPIVARVTLTDGRSATDATRVIRLAGPLSVRETFPAKDATDVDPAVVILATVSNPLEGSTVAGAFKVTDSTNTAIAGDLYVDRDAISFAPHDALKRGERYTITIAQSLKDAAASALDAAYSSSFAVGSSAPNTPPVVDPIPDGCFTDATITGRATIPGARVQIEVDGVKVTKVSNATTGAFDARVTFSGQPGFHSVRVRELGGDGTYSPERSFCVRVNCAAPRVVAAALDRTTKKLTIQFSKSMNASTLALGTSIKIEPEAAAALTGTLAMNAANDTATITIIDTIPATSITLTVTRAAKDATGTGLAAEYTQVFTVDGGTPSASGKGYISGAVYDATKGRPLSGALVAITGEPSTVTNDSGRYASRPLAEGAYTIRASASGRTTVWRQAVVPVGAGVLPIDIRLTERGPEVTTNGSAQTLTHGGDTTVTKKIDLALAAASLTTGKKVRLTAVGAQSLAGLLPLGWSPLAAAEIVVDDSTDPAPMPGATLTFDLDTDAAKVTAATQTLSVAQYDSDRDEWRVAVPVANLNGNKVTVDLAASGNYALVYADKAVHLAHPAVARAGAVLTGVANPCLTTPEVCLLRKIDFKLNPQAVLPNGRTTATLSTEGAGATQTYPSGTAVQAYIDEQLNLADGRVLIDPPFATDLLVYRDLAGNTGIADFHLAPTPQAAAAMLRDGVDHIRVVDYPGRIDRGTLIGADGGRVPGDDAVTIDIPSGATTEPLHATVASLTAADLASYGSIAGFRIAGGFTFSLTRTSEPTPIEGVTVGAPQLIKPARATFAVSPIPTNQVIVAEVLSSTPYGSMLRIVAATTGSTTVDVPGSKIFTTRAAPSGVPIDGIVRDGRYLVLAAESPIAYAYGQVRVGDANGLALANARVTSGIGKPMTAPLGVGELTRIGGVFAIPVAANAPAYSLLGRSIATGDGDIAVAAQPATPDTFVNFGALVLAAQPPQLVSVTPDGTSEVDVFAPFAPQAKFNVAIDPTLPSVTGGLVIRNVTAGTTMNGSVSAVGDTVKFTPSEALQADSQYSITVAPTIRALTNGTPFGKTVTKQFHTRALPANNNTIHPERISITIPDENGKSTIRGLAGALPTGDHVIAVRRGRFFIVSYETTVTNADGSFSFDAGHQDPKDKISIEDDIDLRVIDATSHAVVAVIPLNFASADGRTVIANPTKTVTVTSADGISITIEEGTFDVRTPVTINKSEKSALASVPKFDQELHFSAGVEVKFDGVAKKRMQLDVPAPAGASAAKSYFLGYLGQSIRGPRIELADSLRLENGKFTTTLGTGSNLKINVTSSGFGQQTSQVISNPADVKRFLIGVLRSGIYATVDLNVSCGWTVVSGVTAGVDMFWDSYASLFASQFTLIETHGRALIPVTPNKQFQVVGVDASTGLERFRKVYDPIAAGDPFAASIVPAPIDDEIGPYPVFASPGRYEVIDTAPIGTTLTSVRGLEVRVLGDDIRVKRTDASGRLEVLNTATPQIISTNAIQGTEIPIPGKALDRILVSLEANNVDPFTPVSITFNRSLYVGPSTAPDAVDAFFKSGTLFKIESGTSLGTLSPITEQAKFSVDSQNRRVMVDLNGALQMGRLYRITISKNLQGVKPDGTAGLKLAQKLSSGTTGPELGDDLHLLFYTRTPGGELASFNLTSGSVRDLAINGNVALVSALNGGVQAFDISDPAALATASEPIGKTATGVNDMWGIASDRHGRIYTTALEAMFGSVRSYRLEDFLPVSPGTTRIVQGTVSNAIVCWSIGASAGLPFATSATIVSDRPEAIPRKLQVLLQDKEEKLDVTSLINPAPPLPPPPQLPGGFARIQITVPAESAIPYQLQRVTIENRTAGLHWSKDIPRGGSQTFDILARKGDEIYRVRNEMTYGVISLFGYGIGVFDLNAVESNDHPVDTGYKAIREKVTLTDVKPCQPNPYVTCTAADYEPKCPTIDMFATAPKNVPCPIREISFTPEALITTGAGSSSVNVYSLDSYRGVLDVTIDPPEKAGAEAITTRHTGLSVGSSPSSGNSYHQRLLTLRQFYLTKTGREPRPRFQSIAPYLTYDKDGKPLSYALITGRDFGLLVVKLDGAQLTPDHLVDLVWIPAGAVAVRVIPRSDLAVVVDGAGRVLLVNLKKIDESDKVSALPPCSSTCVEAEMFPTAWKAANATTAPLPAGADWFELGADDPRIIWKSAPKTVLGTLAPVIDPDTGILFTGDVLGTRIRAIAATDPHPRVMVNMGDAGGYQETGGIIPLGIDPPADAPLKNPGASLSVFRIEVTLPGSITESLVAAGNKLRFAVESERTLNGVTGQTPKPLPAAHLRRSDSAGKEDVRPAPDAFSLSRIVPYDASDAELRKLRYQSGYNRFVSPWIVALADPRASSQYDWSPWGITAADDNLKREHGCFSCTKPSWLTGTAGTDFFEIYSYGRYFSVRPEVCKAGESGCVQGNAYFEPTAYQYLGRGDRLVTRVSTVMADSVRPTHVLTAAQVPPVAGGSLQGTVFVHSGELMHTAIDHSAGGRAGWNVVFDRTYRSRTLGLSPLARGWDSSNFQRLRELPTKHVEYRDGSGELWLFKLVGSSYTSPTGLYLKLTKNSDGGWDLIDQKFRISRFDSLGRLVRQTDEFFDGDKAGNTIRYYYDRDSHLASIVDPVGRSTDLLWNNDRLETVKDWRQRRVVYHYDDFGRLERVELPKTKGQDSTPEQHYKYKDAAAAQYSNGVDLGANLETITEPGDDQPRVTYSYFDSGLKRDMVQDETWGTSDNAKPEFAYTMPSGTFPSPTKTVVTDALKQVREYTFENATQPKDYASDRAHATKIVEKDVPVWQLAAFGAALPGSVSKSDTGKTPAPHTIEPGFTEGRMTSLKIDGVSTTTFGYDPVAPVGFVLSSKTVDGLAGAAGLAQTYEHDGAFMKSVTSDGKKIDSPEAHNGVLELTAEDGGVQQITTVLSTGLVKEVKSIAVDAPAQGSGDYVKLDYLEPDDPQEYKRSLPWRTTMGLEADPDGNAPIVSELTYLTPDSEHEEIPSRSYERDTEFDELGRVLNSSVTGPDTNTKDEYTYDLRGRLLTHRSKQTDTQFVEDRYAYDRVGRVTEHSVYEIKDGTPKKLSITTTEYKLPQKQIITTLPEKGTITTNLDGLGRQDSVVSDPKQPTYATFLTQTNAYDLDGNPVFSTDGKVAVANKYDAVHRLVETRRSNGTSAKKTWDGWYRLTDHVENETLFTLHNDYTDAGKLQTSSTNTLSQEFAWDGAGRTRKAVSKGGLLEPVRESQAVYDTAGRLISSRFGQQGTSVTIGRLFHHMEWVYEKIGVPSKVTSFEDNDAQSYTWKLSQDALGRTTRVENEKSPDFFMKQTYDQLGNVTSVKSPDRRGSREYNYDARGLARDETKKPAPPDPTATTPPANTITTKFDYDDNGVLKQYLDATGEPTDVQNDGFGRPYLRKYPDNSTEEIYYFGARVNKMKDRQNRWQFFEYEDKGRLSKVTNGSGTTLDELAYHPDGRLKSWKNADSIVEFENYDAEGRPHLTRQTRLKSDGTTLDSFTQTHEYNGFGQRTSWTMPGASTFGTDGWTKSVTPKYDAAGNLIKIERDVNNAGVQTLMDADYRAAGRPKHRTLHTNFGSTTPIDIDRQYEYGTDGIGRMSAFRVSAGGTLTAGSEVQYEGTKLTSAKLLGIANGGRTTQWHYDDHGRLDKSVAASTQPVVATGALVDAITQHLNDADFIEKIEKSTPGAAPKEFGESDAGHKTESINAEELHYKTADNQENGSLRTEDGRFYYVYDEKARLRRAILKPVSGALSVMQVRYTYNAGGRMIGRRVEIADYAAQALPDAPLPWTLATSAQIGPDAVLPPSTTFVWDPISDQLISVFEAEKTDAKPIRQYIHGGMGMDDPVEVAVGEATGVARYYPIYDEAGDGGLQTILRANGSIVTRTILEDPYGDGELAINGPAVDNLTLTATKAGDGTINEMLVDVRVTEPIASSSTSAARLTILDAGEDIIATATQVPTIESNGYVLRWKLTGSEWTALTTTAGAKALSILITDAFRSKTFGPDVAVLSADTSSSSSISTENGPFEYREQLSLIADRFATLAAGATSSKSLYEMKSLGALNGVHATSARTLAALAGGAQLETADSASALLLTSIFQAQPFADPFTLKNYVRARWYDPATGGWLGPDPEGYNDSSNLYSFGGGDPVNMRDPSGREARLESDGAITILSTKSFRIMSYSADYISKHGDEIRLLLVTEGGLSPRAADAMMISGGYGAWVGNMEGIHAAAVGTEIAEPGVRFAATGLSVMSSFTGVGLAAQLTQSYMENGVTTKNVIFTALAVAHLGWTDSLVTLDSAANATNTIRTATAVADNASRLTRMRRFFYDPRPFREISRAYWEARGPANGASLHHWLFPQRAAMIPVGLRNAGFNLLELGAFRGIFHRSLSLNTWMGFALRWGGARARNAQIVENSIRVGLPAAATGAGVLGYEIGKEADEFFHVDDWLHSVGNPNEENPEEGQQEDK
ncbi:MAG TPA: Ig-like domain-containing protein [Thermoanaerobaculia bacterium]|nr:Ig-like domain-containing protein [Thermoanaerobaculia bacterium]